MDKEQKDRLEAAREAVLVPGNETPETPVVRGFDWNEGLNLQGMLDAYMNTGFQATELAKACEEVNHMLEAPQCTIFLGFTSNMSSCGIREHIRFLAQHRLVDCMVTTAGGIEEDLMKCLAPTYLGDFHLDGANLRSRGLNRIGNLLVPNANYVAFEEWLTPHLDHMLRQQVEQGTIWSPSSIIRYLGQHIDNEDSWIYWCAKNDIPVFCPALTDGSIGDMMYFHSIKNDPSLIVDIVRDIKALNSLAGAAKVSGQLILGGGTPKHQICNANLMRNGANYSCFINTGLHHDGSDSGADPDEAVSWGKIRAGARCIKVFSEITLVFPLMMAQTFAKFHHEGKKRVKEEDTG